MECPACGHQGGDLLVLESRNVSKGPNKGCKKRRRQCGQCEHRWTTYEISQERLKALHESQATDLSYLSGEALHEIYERCEFALEGIQNSVLDYTNQVNLQLRSKLWVSTRKQEAQPPPPMPTPEPTPEPTPDPFEEPLVIPKWNKVQKSNAYERLRRSGYIR
jgi:hypothetical protein